MRIDGNAHPVPEYVGDDIHRNGFHRCSKIWLKIIHISISFKNGVRNWMKISFHYAVLVPLIPPISLILQHIMFATLSIEHQLVSPATTLYFTRNMRMKKDQCLKVWQRPKYGKHSSEDDVRDIDHLMEGLQFNSRFAPGIYLGLTRVKGLDQTSGTIRHGWILQSWMLYIWIVRCWIKGRVRAGDTFALVMRRLPEQLRLDHQWQLERLGTPEGMELLAIEVARMHRRLKKSPKEFGTSKQISAKQTLNTTLFFSEGLHQLATTSEDIILDKYKPLEALLVQAFDIYRDLFEERYRGDHIRRCHGDLKTTNLWLCPENSLFRRWKKSSQRLVSLDCVDFRPDFCHIDTLSDVALLTVDLEARLSSNLDKDTKSETGMELAAHFLSCYLQKVGDSSESSWILLEYYLLEKAMVCTYVSLLFDQLPELGKKYLNIALFHAQRLEKLCQS